MTTTLVNLFRQSEDYFLRSIAKEYLDFDGEARAYLTGVKAADSNFVYIKKNTSILDGILNQSKQFYDKKGVPFVAIIPQEFCVSEVENTLKIMGYLQTGKSVAMVIKLEDFTSNMISFDDEITIHTNSNKLGDWMMPLIGAFNSTFEIGLQYLSLHESALKNKFKLYHFSLYKLKDPIASITLSTHGAIARIDDVATLPEFQGKGYASALVNYVISEAKKLSMTHCFLESSESGFSVYQKLGFQSLFENHIYSYSKET